MAERVALDRLKPASWNPRTLRDERFRALCRSIESDPDFLTERPILAMLDGTIYGGNQKYHAVKHLGWSDVPASLADIPEWQAKERALKDNQHFGDDDGGGVAEILAELQLHDRDLALLGYEDDKLAELLGTIDAADAAVASAESEELELRYQIIVECHTEQRQAELLERFDAEGITCRALMS